MPNGAGRSLIQELGVTLRGWATFAWQSDYGQFYLLDGEEQPFLAPAVITAELEQRRVFAPAAGLVIYTADCLQQHIRIAIHRAEPDQPPTEPVCGKRWTQVETVRASFPSRRFSISSPSKPPHLPSGPHFSLETDTVTARVAWMECQDSRDDTVPVEPDVIEVTLWPG